MRRFTPLTNGFRKQIDHRIYAMAPHFLHYNFAWIHKPLRITPAMAAGPSDRLELGRNCPAGSMKTFKKFVCVVCKIVGWLAAAVLFFAPVTSWGGWEAMGAALVVGFACFAAYHWADDEREENTN